MLRTGPRSPRESQIQDGATRFLLTLLVQSRWNMLMWKLMFKHRPKYTGRGELPGGRGRSTSSPSRATAS
eukprot:5339848-Alexandrium_andersonii.AAC.1